MSDLIVVETPACMECGEKSYVFVDYKSYGNWIAGLHIQDAFPNATADQREMLMTGIHPSCWDSMFGDEDA